MLNVSLVYHCSRWTKQVNRNNIIWLLVSSIYYCYWKFFSHSWKNIGPPKRGEWYDALLEWRSEALPSGDHDKAVQLAPMSGFQAATTDKIQTILPGSGHLKWTFLKMDGLHSQEWLNGICDICSFSHSALTLETSQPWAEFYHSFIYSLFY